MHRLTLTLALAGLLLAGSLAPTVTAHARTHTARGTKFGPTEDRFWVAGADGRGGRYLRLRLDAGPCSLTQFAWLVDSSGIAYVTLCADRSGDGFTERLNSAGLDGAPPRVLYTLPPALRKLPWDRIDLAPLSRLQGGGGV